MRVTFSQTSQCAQFHSVMGNKYMEVCEAKLILALSHRIIRLGF